MKPARQLTRRDPLAGWTLLVAAAGAWLLVPTHHRLSATEPPSPAAVLQDLRSFRELGTVLLIAAHPDDENTQLITYLARGRGCRMAYLSVTRGDGGQNVLGPEFGDELGVIRTQELLAARRLDGGRQFFTRAIDFGFSKDHRETLNLWGQQQVVGDVVRVLRTFRPDVVVTRFSTQASGTHGHHTASAVLGVEAFKLSGDPHAFPEQLDQLTVWQPKRVMLNGGGGGRGGGRGDGDAAPGVVRIEAGGNDPVLGVPFTEIASRSRAMHKTQGFGNFGGGAGGRGGAAAPGGPRTESFQLIAGEPAKDDIMDGVETTWKRFAGGAEIARAANEAVEKFNSQNLLSNVPALLAIRSLVDALPPDPLVREKRAQLDRILQACLGLSVETVIPVAEVVPGETLRMHHAVRSAAPLRWVAVRYPVTGQQTNAGDELRPGQPAGHDATQTVPATMPLSQPYWLRAAGTPGLFRVDEASLIGQAENPPAFPVEFIFEIDGQKLVVLDEPVQVTADGSTKETRRRLDVVPPVSLRFLAEVRAFAPGASRPVEVEATAYRAGASGTLRLDVPAGWKVEPAERPFRLATVGQRERFTYDVVAPDKPATAELAARAEVNGVSYSNGRVELVYDHIPRQVLQPPARQKAMCLNLAIRGRRVGYLSGAGDSVAEALQEMGYAVSELAGNDLVPERLRELDAVVIGIRAANVRKDLAERMPALFDFVAAGGNVIMQYNRPEGLQTRTLAPFDLRLSSQRVTDENAAVRFLAPDHPALNVPNKITSADFNDWVQERGIYFPDQWGAEFTPILAASDPGELPLEGGLLVARHGKGYFVYTSLVWFRQLPAGVPGAYRLFANLVSLGK